jgi:alkylation response protein AidB-like acyl-CoA dehydrogenase
MTGESDFNDIFFDGARTAAENIVGTPGDGWRIAMATLSYERGVSTFGYQVRFQRELSEIALIAQGNGKSARPLIRQRLAEA